MTSTNKLLPNVLQMVSWGLYSASLIYNMVNRYKRASEEILDARNKNIAANRQDM